MSWQEPPAWAANAACAGRIDLFYPPGGTRAEAGQRVHADRARVAAAKAICAECPVLNECTALAVRQRNAWASVVGGLTTIEARDLAATTRLAMRGDVLVDLGIRARRDVVAVTIALAVPDHASVEPNGRATLSVASEEVA